jgi:hypothetical protein
VYVSVEMMMSTRFDCNVGIRLGVVTQTKETRLPRPNASRANAFATSTS